MWIKKKHRWALSENEATPESVYKERRDILKKLGIAVVGVPLAANSQAGVLDLFSSTEQPVQDRRIDLPASKPDKYQADL